VKRMLTAAVAFGVALAAWQLGSTLGLWSSVLVPSPAAIAAYLATGAADGTLLAATLVTARRLAIGYAIGVGIGIPLGLCMSRSRILQDTLGVLALGLQTLPSVCWVPLALLWFGQTETAMAFVVVMGTSWAILLATADGVRNVPPIYVRAARTMGAGPMHTLVHVTLPASLPYVIGGMKQGWAFAWRSLMAAEIYVTVLTGFGLGHLLHYGRELHAMEQVVGVMVVIVVIGLIVDRALFSPIERALHRRWGTGRS
jgi:NitT/TauT family transport system permease protein